MGTKKNKTYQVTADYDIIRRLGARGVKETDIAKALGYVLSNMEAN
jgi:hypothetical protein